MVERGGEARKKTWRILLLFVACVCVEGGEGEKNEHWHEEEKDKMEDEQGRVQVLETRRSGGQRGWA